MSINRTFMELKQNAHFIGVFGVFVLIEPLWNWNVSVSNAERPTSLVLIEPLWNWNTTKDGPSLFTSSSINRTFMELKHRRMEAFQKFAEVLIEPLWNWNNDINVNVVIASGINRTFMELKHNRYQR